MAKRTRGLQQIHHKGKEMFFSDYGDLGGQEFIDVMRRNVDECIDLVKRSGRRDILLLNDVTDAVVTPRVFGVMKELVTKMKPYTRARAVVGVTGAKKQLLQIANKFSGVETEAFATVEEAKEWLATQ